MDEIHWNDYIREEILFRCSDCNCEYNLKQKLPDSRIEIDGLQHLSSEDKQFVVAHLMGNLATFFHLMEKHYKTIAEDMAMELTMRPKVKISKEEKYDA